MLDGSTSHDHATDSLPLPANPMHTLPPLAPGALHANPMHVRPPLAPDALHAHSMHTLPPLAPDALHAHPMHTLPSLTREALHARFLKRKREQCAWDAEEARDLRIAESLQLWTHFACVTLVEYLELYCGIEPRTALDRIRVSFALAELPLLEAELESGGLQFSHVKELTRILVPDTEAEWLHHTRGMTYREVQRAIAGHVRGDRPTDPPQADERKRYVGFHIKPSTTARFYALIDELEDERGDRFVDDDDRINALCDRATSIRDTCESPARCCGNAPAQVWITTEGHVYAHGVQLDDAASDALLCDATIMGHVDDPNARPTHTIKRNHRRRILARDMHRCQVPNCRSKRHLDVHHIIYREHGGTDADDNLVTLCSGHHRLHHAGLLGITGRMPTITFRRVNAEGSSCPRGHKPRGSRIREPARRQRAPIGDGAGI